MADMATTNAVVGGGGVAAAHSLAAVANDGQTAAPAETIKLISADGFEFVLEKRFAMISSTIRNMLSSPGNFTESIQNEVHFRDIKAVILEKVCQYLMYKVRYSTASAAASDIPEFPIEPELSLELLMAADFLDC